MMERILMIDDSREQLEIYKHYLENDYEVICCESGREGLESIEQKVPSLILLDIEMPFMDGFEVLERIRSTDGCYNIPVIGLTGKTEKSVVLSFMSKGADGYLLKPISKENLLQTIQKHLEEERRKEVQKKVLLVDDDLEQLRIYQNFLKTKYNVTALNSGKLAIEYLMKYKPDIILLDYLMYPFNGISLFQMIRKMEQVKDVPIGFITGCTEKDILLECTALKPSGVILKPIDKEDFLEKVAEMLLD